MASTLRRMPPPPPLTQNPEFNRWLHDLQSFILSTGGIDTSQISGYTGLQSQVSTNTSDISANTSAISTLNSQMSTADNNISSLQATQSTHTSQIAALQANPIVRNGSGAPSAGLGNNGDWYGDYTNGAAYVKVSGVWKLV